MYRTYRCNSQFPADSWEYIARCENDKSRAIKSANRRWKQIAGNIVGCATFSKSICHWKIRHLPREIYLFHGTHCLHRFNGIPRSKELDPIRGGFVLPLNDTIPLETVDMQTVSAYQPLTAIYVGPKAGETHLDRQQKEMNDAARANYGRSRETGTASNAFRQL